MTEIFPTIETDALYALTAAATEATGSPVTAIVLLLPIVPEGSTGHTAVFLPDGMEVGVGAQVLGMVAMALSASLVAAMPTEEDTVQ